MPDAVPSSSTGGDVYGANEIVVGVVYGSGTDMASVRSLLRDSFASYSYDAEEIRLSKRLDALFARAMPNADDPEWVRTHQDYGDALRRALDEQAAMAQLAMSMIRTARRQRRDSDRPDRVAWIVRSLKRPEEVSEFRRVYGARFILLSVHMPEALRLKAASRRWERKAPHTSGKYDVDALEEIRRDEEDPHRPFGQAVRRTFPQGDFFVDASSLRALKESIPRLVDVVFGAPFCTPTREEYAMGLAHTASLRSSEMGRQVGAAIITRKGELVALGTNEVPSAGGQYWYPDEPDGRDFAQQPPVDSSEDWKRRIARELLKKLRDDGWVSMDSLTQVLVDRGKSESDRDSGVGLSEDQLLRFFLGDLDGTRIGKLIEFGRAVHAEMAALIDAARRGGGVAGALITVTTYPCHNCMKHLIAAGLTEIVFLHPYEKSLADQLHSEALVVDPDERTDERRCSRSAVAVRQFIGVAPRGYPFYFSFTPAQRKDDEGRARTAPENRSTLRPRVLWPRDTWSHGGSPVPVDLVHANESEAVTAFTDGLLRADLEQALGDIQQQRSKTP